MFQSDSVLGNIRCQCLHEHMCPTKTGGIFSHQEVLKNQEAFLSLFFFFLVLTINIPLIFYGTKCARDFGIRKR